VIEKWSNWVIDWSLLFQWAMNVRLITFSEWSMNERLICFWWSKDKSGPTFQPNTTYSLYLSWTSGLVNGIWTTYFARCIQSRINWLTIPRCLTLPFQIWTKDGLLVTTPIRHTLWFINTLNSYNKCNTMTCPINIVVCDPFS
jgi:hypothetical protein